MVPSTVPTPPEQAGAAEDDGGEHVELLADEHGRRHRLGELRLHQRGDAGDEAHIAVDDEVQAEEVEAEALRGVADCRPCA